ncbi:hypothetical protein IMX26_13905 [Clostridium sp. 'deep sea']|uniref:hypothetical protein n=1 Tax=Clostridium sp. 'deep sea' TaxID=2779445 RepID=UPI00189676C9|nr:hypothetical protein [Clostridium sp. 'deep sea']QOR34558.1 hypothetical protein IMX26_13905 [Clostridium sp. 'deep sea']
MRDIKGESNTINIFEGDIKNKESIDNFVIGTQIINNPTQKQDEIKYEIKQGKLRLNKNVISIVGGSFSLVGLLGFISSIFTIVGGIKDGQFLELTPISNYYFISLLIGILVLFFSIKLRKKRIVSIFSKYIFGFQLGLFKDGTVARLKIASSCPKQNCGGKLNFYYNENEDKYYFICSRNSSQHRFEFDFTTLEY